MSYRLINFCSYILVSFCEQYIILLFSYSDEGSLDSPSDHPPMSPKGAQSPDELTIAPKPTQCVPIEKQNGEKPVPHISSDTNVKIRRYLNFILAITYFYTKPLIEVT